MTRAARAALAAASLAALALAARRALRRDPVEEGRRLASRREDLLAAGADPALLVEVWGPPPLWWSEVGRYPDPPAGWADVEDRP